MRPRVDKKTHATIQQARQAVSATITDTDLASLPEPVQRYLRYAQVLNKPRVKCVKVRQKGWMRTGSGQNWMPIEAVQYTTLVEPFSRTWYARARIGPLNLLSGYDRYDNGTGHMLMRLLSMFPVVDVRGPEIDLSALITYVNDMVMWPTAFLSDYIQWEPIDAVSARIRVSLHEKHFSAILRFNELGEMVDFLTEERYRSVGKTFQQAKWSTPFRNYRMVHDFRLPSEGEAIWHLKDGEIPYFKVAIGDIQYDIFDFA